MSTSLADLPFDVLFEIFKSLSVQAICRVGQTCKQLHGWVDEPWIWTNLFSHQRTMFTGRPTIQAPIAANEMRRRVIHETIVDAEWQKTNPEPRVVTKLYLRSQVIEIHTIEMFPGGDFLLITLEDGSIDIRHVGCVTRSDERRSPLGPYVSCAASRWALVLTRSTLVLSSDRDGYIFVEVRHSDDPESDHRSHIRCYSYHLETVNAKVKLIADFTIPNGATIHSWSIFGDLIGYILEDATECLHFSRFNPTLLFPITNISIMEAGFDTFQLAWRSPFHNDSYELVMLSSHRLLLVSLYCVLVYDIPHTNELSAVPVATTWRWSPETKGARPHYFQPGRLSYGRNSTKPTIWIFEGAAFINCFHLSNSGSPVEQHQIFTLDYLNDPAIGHSRAICIDHPVRGIVDVSTMSLLDPPTQGSFSIHLEEGEEGKFSDVYAFDEISGRVAVVVEAVASAGCPCIYVTSISRLVAYHGRS